MDPSRLPTLTPPTRRTPADPVDPSEPGVTGVIQVGGGPVGSDLGIDQKSGPRTGSGAETTGSGSATEASEPSVGTPAGGVMPMGSIEGTPVGSELSPDPDRGSTDQSKERSAADSEGRSRASAEDSSNDSDAHSTGDRFTSAD